MNETIQIDQAIPLIKRLPTLYLQHTSIVELNFLVEWLQTPSAPDETIKDLSIRYRPHEVNIPALFFDGAQQEGVCGCGAWLKLDNGERYNISWNGGPGTNNKAELLALWSGLLVALHLMIPCINIYGDSQVVIGGISGRTTL